MTSRLPNPFEAALDESGTLGDDYLADGLIGKTIAGRYRVTSILGRGGMGVVDGGTHLEPIVRSRSRCCPGCSPATPRC